MSELKEEPKKEEKKYRCEECKDTGSVQDAYGFFPCTCERRSGGRTG